MLDKNEPCVREVMIKRKKKERMDFLVKRLADFSAMLISESELAAIWGMPLSTISKARRQGKLELPHVKILGKIKYRLEDVESYVNQRVTFKMVPQFYAKQEAKDELA